VFLTEGQRQRAAQLAGGEPPRALVARYVARRDGAVVGRAYVDTHVVRTKRESLLVSLEPDGRLRRIDVTAFAPGYFGLLGTRPALGRFPDSDHPADRNDGRDSA